MVYTTSCNTGPNKLHTVSHISIKEKSTKRQTLTVCAIRGSYFTINPLVPFVNSVWPFGLGLVMCGKALRPPQLSQPKLEFCAKDKPNHRFIIRRSLDLLFCVHTDLQLHSEQKRPDIKKVGTSSLLLSNFLK